MMLDLGSLLLMKGFEESLSMNLSAPTDSSETADARMSSLLRVGSVVE
jgi:hypothetical protein